MSTLYLQNPSSFVLSASLTVESDRAYCSVKTKNRTAFEVFKTERGAKNWFARNYLKGAVWKTERPNPGDGAEHE